MSLLGFDVGSSSVKASLIDETTGNCLAEAFFPKSEAEIISCKAGWAEQDPDIWWDNLVLAARSVLEHRKDSVSAIGISYQMHGLVCVDKNHNPLRNAIIWCDSRAIPYGESAFRELGSEWCMKHILNSPGNFTASKLAWVKENEPEIFGRIWKIMLPGDYIAMKMTGEACTTPGGLSEGMMWDFTDNAPAQAVLDCFGFSSSVLPEVKPTFSEQGRLTAAAAAELGLEKGIPVTYRAGDQPNNALSLGVMRPGEVAAAGGTSGVVYGVSDKVASDPMSRVNVFAHVNHSQGDPRLGVLLCINGTGIMNSWVRRNVMPEGVSYSQMNATAAEIPVGSEGLSILPFGNGAERMLGNADAGCSIHGLNFNVHGRSHIVRASQEGIAFSFRQGIGIMNGMGMSISKVRACASGLFLSDIFCDTLASVTGATIELMQTDGAAGAARGAGIGAGIFKSADEALSTLKPLRRIEPRVDMAAPCSEAFARWQHCLEQGSR